MGWVVSLIIGGIVGWVASIIMKTNAQMGLLANIVIGIVGGAVGFWVAGLLGFAATGGIARFVISVLGAALLIFLLRALGLFRPTPGSTTPRTP